MTMLLLNPGPVVLSQRVREAMLKPDLCHREPEFTALQNSIREQLLAVYDLNPEDWAAILLTGSGTSAMEAMITSLVPHAGKLLIIENGVYGERLSKIAEIYAIPHSRLVLQWGEQIDIDAVAARLDQDEAITHVAVVHHETTTGRLNPIEELGAICQARGAVLLMDGVSSFGAEAINFEEWGVSACAATANKCLHGVPGTSFVITRRTALPEPGAKKRSLYLDLESYCRNQDKGGTPFTQSVQTFYALDEALREMHEQGGWQARHAQYHALARQVREGLAALGIDALLSEDDSSVVLNAYDLPQGVSYTQLHDHLKAAGFVIYAGQGDLAKTLFRISTMGEISEADITRLLAAIANLCGSH